MADVLHQSAFTVASDTALGDYTPDVGSGWTVDAGTYTVNGASDYLSVTSHSGSGTDRARFTTEADGTYSLRIYNGTSTNRYYRIIFRYVDANNYWYVRIRSRASQVDLYRVVSGSGTLINNSNAFETLSAFTHTWVLTLNGNSISLTADGTPTVSATDSTHATATSHGVGVESDYTLPRFDDVTFSTLDPEPTLAVSTGDIEVSGPQGGPFDGFVLNIANTAGGTLNWSLTDDVDWLDYSISSGSLGVGEDQDVTVTFNAAAEALTAGEYQATIDIDNDVDGTGDTELTVDLTVSAGFSGSPSSPGPIGIYEILQFIGAR